MESLPNLCDGNMTNLSKPVEEGYIITGNIITSISYNFVKWALAFGKMLGIDIPAKTFGIQ